MHIAVTLFPGYTEEEKILLARKLKSVAADVLNIIPCTVSVSMKGLPYNEWDNFIRNIPDDDVVIPESYKH